MRVGRRPQSDQRASTGSTSSYRSDHLDFQVERLEDRRLLSADFGFVRSTEPATIRLIWERRRQS